jgi:hypothetical protein
MIKVKSLVPFQRDYIKPEIKKVPRKKPTPEEQEVGLQALSAKMDELIKKMDILIKKDIEVHKQLPK